jgi:hypothetical protein
MRYSYRSPPPTGDFDWGGGQEFSVELHVRGAAIEKALERVAVPTLGGNRLFIPSGTSWESYGFTESRGGLRVDYASVTREAHAVVGPIAVDLLERAREQSLDLHDTVDLIASFVQKSIPYKIPPDVRRRPDGSLVATGGFLTPLAALAQKPSTAPGGWGWGDCDTKSSLLGALFGSIKGLDTVMFVGRGHAFVGVAIAPRRNDMIVEWRGRVWVLIETTARWPVGRIERDTLRHIGELEVVAI